jgi:signal transduction histidine kinase
MYLMRDRAQAVPAGAVAHKLKQPLAVAWGYLELILDDSSTLDPTTLRYLREIQLAVQSMDDIVSRLQLRAQPDALDSLRLEALPTAA